MEALQTLAALMPYDEATDSDAHAAVLLHVKPDAKGPALASPRGAGLLACVPRRVLALTGTACMCIVALETDSQQVI